MQTVSTTFHAACLAGIMAFSASSLFAGEAIMPEPIMIKRGESVVSKGFSSDRDVDKESMALRKETQYQIKDGGLHIIPPSIAFKGKENGGEWATSTMARAGLLDIPAEFVCQFRWKYNQSLDPKFETRGLAYIDLGHRCIRVTMGREGSVLVLENHLVGREAKASIVLQEAPDLKLESEKWYDVTIEVKGDEAVFQIDGHILYGRHPLIAKERYSTFNIDSGGDGYVWDHIDVWTAGDHLSEWKSKRKSLSR